jgi:hypothetical protein
MNNEYISSDRIDFENLVGAGISSLLLYVENKRLVKADMRIATLSNPGIQEIIRWEKECEDLFNRLENYFKNY